MLPGNLHQHQLLLDGIFDFDGAFDPSTFSLKDRWLRKYGAAVIRQVPSALRLMITDLVKKNRNPSGVLRLNSPLDLHECRGFADAVRRLDARPWFGKKGVIALCHDVDNDIGWRYVRRMGELDARHGVPATFNLLTHDNYRVDGALIRSLLEAGHEIGLHGHTHDQGLAFRPEKVIAQQLSAARTALERLSVHVTGFRAPALSLSPDLLTVLAKLGFGYDSTFQIASPFYHSVKLPYPNFLKKFNLWEIPLMVQDDNYFRDTRCAPAVIFRSLEKLIRDTEQLNGVFVINMHPHAMVGREQFYIDFLKFLNGFTDMKSATLNEVVRYGQGRAEKDV